MTEFDFFRYKCSVKCLLEKGLNGEIHSWALWKMIADQLELLIKEMDGNSRDCNDVAELYCPNLIKIRHAMQETYDYSGYDKNNSGQRIKIAVAYFNERYGVGTTPTNTNQPQHLTRHYNSTLTDEQLNKIFSTLTNNGYLAAESDLQGWLWICAGKGEKTATEPLKWIGKQNTLAEFANWICGSNNPTDWETTAACFVLSTGSKPNINAMKQHNIAEKEKTKLLNLLKTATQQKEK